MVVFKIFLVTSIILGVIAQLFLKLGMKKANVLSVRKTKKIELLKKLFLNKAVVLGFFSYGMSLLLWVLALSELDLSYAYPMVSLSYVLVAFSSMIFFKEEISKQRWVAIAVITLGVILVGLS
tara:strand:- start:1926 stop:2294 length:369 start_codon:yes stop_codon:yes gene_type:complete